MGKQFSVRSRIRYALDNFMARGGLSVFLALLLVFLAAFVVMAVLRLVGGLIWPDETAVRFVDGLWRTMAEIADPGNIGNDEDAPYVSKAIGIATILVGMVLFSSMVAFITAQFEAKMETLRRGRSAVIESGHSLILGFGDRVLDIIREIIIANESEKDAAIVVLAEKDKQEMDDLLNDRIPDRKKTRIITRSGLIANISSLEKASASSARSITILSDARPGDSDAEKGVADARVLKAIMAVVASVGETQMAPVVAQLHLEKNRALAESVVPGRITTLAEDSLLAKMLVQTSRVSGLALVYADLVGFEGNEVYFFRPPSGWTAGTFGQLQYHFPKSVPLGILQASGVLQLNPPPDYAMRPDDNAVMLAEDDSAIGFSTSPIFTPSPIQPSQARIETLPERQLVVGWTKKSQLILDELAQYLKPGSAIHIVVDKPTPEAQSGVDEARQKYPAIDVALTELDITLPGTLARIVPHTYRNVIILTDDGVGPEEADASTITLLMRFRQYFKAYEQSTGQPATTTIVTELMDSESAELVLKVGVKDYLISNQFVSKILAQVALEPGVMRVYDDLFDEAGSEIYLKPAELFFAELPVTLRFGDCVAAAQMRSEVCFGYKLAAEERDSGRAHGIHLIPPKSEQLTLGRGDCLITLAEHEG